ncbi:hypothetical protein PhCBS80983_g04235 [Powellomyces hirtus]|uniref:DUF726-domain-containing protein n=1 Tax=Powellomyces hirtus TaxID=109895 RepID=A0A507E063_9FUNG|nr:hypothetical protein PhCBS80983_g04235 [Powellomyces hirtus]
MAHPLSPEHAQLFYDSCLYSAAQMRCAMLPACQKDGLTTKVLSVFKPPGVTEEGRQALKSFDTWAQDILDVVWVGILEKDKKDHPSIEQAIEKEVVALEPIVGSGTLQSLPPASRASLLRTFLLLVLTTSKRYDARTRVLLRKLAESLALPFPSDYEESVDQILKHPEEVLKETKAAAGKREESGRGMRNFKIGLAALAGGAVIGITGGLAAPLVGAGFATLLGAVGLGSTAAGMMVGGLASSGMIVGSLFGAYGGHVSSKMVANRTKEVSDFDFKPLRVNQRLHLTLCVTGWLNRKEDVTAPWTVIDGVGDVQALQWEVESLYNLGGALTTMMKSYAIGYLKTEIIKQTVLASLFSALWPLGLLKAGKLVDNPWSNAMELAKKAGVVLADVLIEKVQGERPITLIGYSLGARVIFYCLEELSRRNAYGIVEHAYMFGLPGPGTKDLWKGVRRIVAGRVVNGYSSNDWLLGFLYRTSNIKLMVPGLQAVEVDGVEDFDVGSIVEGHLKYRGTIGKCLKFVNAEDVDEKQLEEQKKVLKAIEKEESVDKLPLDDFVQAELAKTNNGTDKPALPFRYEAGDDQQAPLSLPSRAAVAANAPNPEKV